MAQKEVCPRDEIASPPGTNVLPILTDMVLLKVLCLIVHCVVCNRRRRDLLRIVSLSEVRYSGRHRERLCVSGCLRSPELSAQSRQPNSSTSYGQECGGKVPMVPRPKLFVVR